MIYLNNVQVVPTRFPDNTTQIWKLDEKLLHEKFNIVKWDFQNESEFLELAQLKTLLDEYSDDNRLYISYLPYARQDKEVTNNSTFALTSFAGLLNSLNFDEVILTDPHSQVALNCIINSRATYPIDMVEKALRHTKSSLICYPDKGALTKYTKVYNELPQTYIFGEKVRDQETGEILKYDLVGECQWQKVLIVDDICDGGATFKILTKELIAKGALEVNLFVTHGIFSKGLKTLHDVGISRIFTKNGEAFETQDVISYKML